MGAEIDRLEVTVEAQASKANQQLDLLINKLLKVSNTLTGLNINGFSGMAAGVRNLSAAMKTMSGVKAADFTKTAKGIERLGNVNTSNFQNTAQNVRAMADAYIALSGVKTPQIDTDSITALAKSMGALSKIDGTNFAPAANGIKQVADSMAVLGRTSTKDTGINNTINALKRLVETKLDGFDPAMFGQITQSIAALGGVPDVSRNLNQFISSLSRLAAAGPATQQTANALPALAANLRAAITAVSGAGNISESVNMFVQSVGRLANAGNKTGQTAAQLDTLAQETLNFFHAMRQAPHISRNTIAMTQTLAQLATAGGKVGTATGTVTNAFRRLSSIGKSTLSSVKKVANGIVSSFKKIGNSGGHINTATFSLRNLFRAILPLLGIRQLFNWGKQAVEVASDLTEVQNIVDVTFGDFKDKIEDFASTSIRDFGMSELTAKQISSRFQAMGVAMGFSQGKMADMSVELTKLAADMASFYNVEQTDVAKDLEAIFTGQTRPLRTYGIDLTQATLQEWAMKQGIDANVQSMSQAAKTLLRYQYVMANTGAAQGDFARTAGTWANQTRILAQSFQVLGSTVGNVLINVFKPLVSWLNTVMLKVISVVETIANALGAIFGWTLEITPGGATSDYDDMADGIGGVGDAADAAGGSLGKATEKAKEFQRFLAGFDEIEKIPDESDVASGAGGSGGSGGSGGGAGGGADAGTAQLVKTESLFEKYESDIKTLEQLGEYIGQSLTKAMQSINWDAIYEKARGFGTGLASFLNGLISPELFSETSRLVANSLNTALYALNSFGETFDWTNFGNSIASGINSFFSNFKFDLAADTFDAFANGILDALVAATGKDGIKWGIIGTKISDSVKKALKGIKWDKAYEAAGNFGTGLASFMNSLITKDTFSEIGSAAAGAVRSAIHGVKNWVTKSDFYGWGVSLGSALKSFFNGIKWEDVGLTLNGFFKGLVDFISGLADTAPWEQIGSDIGKALAKVDWATHLYNAAKALMKALGGLLKGFADTPAGDILLGIAAALLTAKIGLAALKLSMTGVTATAVTGGVSAGMAASIGLIGTIISGGLIAAVAQVAVNEYTGGAKTAFQGIADIVGGWFENLAKSDTVQNGIQSFRKFINGAFNLAGIDASVDGQGQETTPEIEVSIDAETEKFDTKVQKSAELLNETLPSETAVDVDASVKVKDFDFKIPKKLRNIPGLTAIADNILPGTGAMLAGISAVVNSVSKATGINSLKDLGASIQEVWKSGNPILKNVQATVSKTDRQSGAELTVTDVGAKVSNTEKQPGSTLSVSDVGAKANSIDWGAQVRETAKILNMHAKADTIDWSAQARETMKTLGVKAESDTVTVTNKDVTVKAGSNKVTVADKDVTVKAGSSVVKIANKDTAVNAQASGITWRSGLSAAAKTLSGIVGIVSSITKGGGVQLALTAVFSVLTTGLKLLFKESGGVHAGGTWRPVTAYAGGGAPDMGQMFIAREAGPELVGTIGGHTAVMNNDQIVSSVSDGVYRAVSAAMAQSGGQNGAAPIINVYVGGKQVTDVVIEDINGRTMATGMCPILT